MLIQQRLGKNDHLHDFIREQLSGKTGLIGIEIGSYQGESTEMFLESGVFSKLYCVDPWLNGYDPNDFASSSDMVLAEQKFDERFKDSDVIIKVKKTSDEAVGMFDDLSVDFVYIDANHQYDAVKKDILNYLPKVKHGGIISGHDYVPRFGVYKAVPDVFGKPPLKVYQEGSWLYIKE